MTKRVCLLCLLLLCPRRAQFIMNRIIIWKKTLYTIRCYYRLAYHTFFGHVGFIKGIVSHQGMFLPRSYILVVVFRKLSQQSNICLSNWFWYLPRTELAKMHLEWVIQSFGMGSWIWFKWTYRKHTRIYNIQWSLSRLKSSLKLWNCK